MSRLIACGRTVVWFPLWLTASLLFFVAVLLFEFSEWVDGQAIDGQESDCRS